MTAPVVLRIFDMRWKIARTLNKEGVPSPRAFYYMAEGRPNPGGGTPYWNDVTVKIILRNEFYLGHMVQNKTGAVFYKVHKQVSKPREDWIKVEHTRRLSPRKFGMLFRGWTIIRQRGAPAAMGKSLCSLASYTVRTAEARRAIKETIAAGL